MDKVLISLVNRPWSAGKVRLEHRAHENLLRIRYLNLDDISALRQFQPAVLSKPLHVVTPRDAYRVEWGGSNKGHLDAYPVGANPPTGPMIYYWLKENEPRVTLEILDANGKLIVRYDNHQDSTIAADSTKKAAHLTAFLDSLAKAGQPRDTAKYVPPEDHSGDDEKPYPQPILNALRRDCYDCYIYAAES